jgi:hypothetical protein
VVCYLAQVWFLSDCFPRKLVGLSFCFGIRFASSVFLSLLARDVVGVRGNVPIQIPRKPFRSGYELSYSLVTFGIGLGWAFLAFDVADQEWAWLAVFVEAVWFLLVWRHSEFRPTNNFWSKFCLQANGFRTASVALVEKG